MIAFKAIKTGNRLVVAWGWGWELRMTANKKNASFWGDGMAAQLCKLTKNH